MSPSSDADRGQCCSTCGRSLRDDLTGVLDRASWHARTDRLLAQAWHHGSPFSLIMVDLDRFKMVNDAYGHLAGDTVLQSFAGMLATVTTRLVGERGLLGRYGGHADEFVITLPGLDLLGSITLARAIHQDIRSLSVTVRTARTVTAVVTGLSASIGVTAYDARDLAMLEVEDLLLDTDLALRQAKQGGRDRIHAMCPPSADRSQLDRSRFDRARFHPSAVDQNATHLGLDRGRMDPSRVDSGKIDPGRADHSRHTQPDLTNPPYLPGSMERRAG